MADFIAVIRRAVDGLSENTPEMRAKVYERAKSAVVRQLENMKPRPPEVMFQRQLDKLDTAIREVEAEHAEAVPADDLAGDDLADGDAPADDSTADAAGEEVQSATPAPVSEPASAVVPEPASAPESIAASEAIPATEPVAPEPVFEPITRPAEIVRREEPALAPVFEPAPVIAAPVAEVPEAQPVQADAVTFNSPRESARDDEIAFVPRAVDTAVVPTEPVYQPFAAPAANTRPAPEVKSTAIADTLIGELAAKHGTEQPARQWPVEIDEEPEPLAVETVEAEPAAPMPKVSYDESDVVAGFNDFVQEEMNRQVVPPPPVKAKKQDDFSWDAPFDDLPEVKKPEAFEKALEAKQREIAAGAEKRKNRQQRVEPVSARAELEDLIGIEPGQRRASSAAVDADGLPPDVSRVVSKLEGKSFKMQKKNKKNKGGWRVMPIALGIVGALVLGGGAYGLWHFKDRVSQLVAGIMPAQDAKTPTDAAKTDAAAKSPVVKTDTAQTREAAKETEVAALTADAGPQKFTQRLLADGTETATDTARVPIDQALPEGKSIAGQTEKSKDVAQTTATDTKSDATAADAGKPVNGAQPIGATQKMFLYEERLGQTSPVAVPGTIVWREKSSTEDGKPDPTIEAQIDIPQRKITAMITIKRNTDASLPASHIIEIVFALPKDFEDGNVDSIQRVAFKQTEQDRGNPLIAVPAKITDDFHMVALNDDADARKVNLELMKTRGWIDIPITYRNGRRALITLEKGATGTAVFDKVMAEWDALGPQTNAAQQ